MSDINVKKETVKSVKWQAIGSYSNTVVSFILGIILARLLLPSDYGTLSMIAIFFTIAGLIQDSGFGTALVQKKDASSTDFSTVFYFNVAVSLICYTLLFLFSPTIADFFDLPILKDLVRVSGLSLVIGSLGSIQGTILYKNLNFKTPAILGITSNIISGIVGVSMAYLGYGVWALVGQSLSSISIRTLGLWIQSNWKPLPVFSKKSFKELFAFGGNVLMGRILNRVINDATPLLIGKFYHPTSLGFYNKGKSIANMPYNLVYGVVASVTFPILSKIQDDKERLVHVYEKYIKVFSLAIFFIMMMVAALAHPLILFLYSSKWESSVIFLQIFSFSTMFTHIHSINCNLILAAGRAELNLKTEVIKKTIWIIALCCSLPFGVIAICIVSVITSQLSLIVNTYYTGKLFGLGYYRQWKIFLPYFLFAFVCCLPAFLLTYTNLPNLICLILGGIISSLLYFGLLWKKKDENLIELIQITPLKKYIKV